LGYQFDPNNKALENKLETMAKYREERAAKILDNINTEFMKEHLTELTKDDLKQIEESADGVLGRPHIADYLIKKEIVKNRQEAFDKYLVKCSKISAIPRRSIKNHPGCRRNTRASSPQRSSWNLVDLVDKNTR
jgi:predicted metal-dependent phosphoesterase TrpH